jgi:hypothetical protein
VTTKAKPIGPPLTSMVAEHVAIFYRDGLRDSTQFGFTVNIPQSWTKGQVALAKRIHRLLIQAERRYVDISCVEKETPDGA